MPKYRNPLEENIFLLQTCLTMTDEAAIVAFRERFGRTLSLAALRKRRQRLGMKKKGWDGQFIVEHK